MLNIEEYLGNREYEFISNFKGMTFVEVLEELEFSNPLSVDELSNFYQLLKAKFEKELFSDTNFLQTRVISHFYKEDDIHILGLKKYGGCEFCNVTGSSIEHYFALIFNVNSKEISFKSCICRGEESVENSLYVGKSLRAVKKLVDHYRSETD